MHINNPLSKCPYSHLQAAEARPTAQESAALSVEAIPNPAGSFSMDEASKRTWGSPGGFVR